VVIHKKGESGWEEWGKLFKARKGADANCCDRWRESFNAWAISGSLLESLSETEEVENYRQHKVESTVGAGPM